MARPFSRSGNDQPALGLQAQPTAAVGSAPAGGETAGPEPGAAAPELTRPAAESAAPTPAGPPGTGTDVAELAQRVYELIEQRLIMEREALGL